MFTHYYVKRFIISVAVMSLITVPIPSKAFPLGFDTELLLLFAGPVSEAVQETVLLVRRGDNFITKESLTIGCVAGASSGFLVGIAPFLGFFELSSGTSPGTFHVIGTMLLSCAMSIVSSATGMGTQWTLHELNFKQYVDFMSK
jgi:hypothetical protein